VRDGDVEAHPVVVAPIARQAHDAAHHGVAHLARRELVEEVEDVGGPSRARHRVLGCLKGVVATVDKSDSPQARSEPRASAVSFITTEHFTLQGARAATITESTARASMFLLSVSSGLVALGLVATATGIGDAFFTFALVLLPTLAFVGLVTFDRTLQSGTEDLGYARRIARLRAYYFDNAPELTPYLLSVPPAQRLLVEGSRGGYVQGFRTVAGMVAVITEQARDNPDSVADVGIDDIVGTYANVIASLEAPPILIGHSFGGLIAERLLGQNLGAAAVAIDAAGIKGVLVLPLSELRSRFPVLKNPANEHRSVMLTAEEFRYAFGNAVSEDESNQLYDKWAIPGPGRPLFEAAKANFARHSPAKVDTDNPTRGPLLLIGGGEDHTVPEAVTKSTLKQYRDSPAATDFLDFRDRGHSLTIDSGWQAIADASHAWLERQGL